MKSVKCHTTLKTLLCGLIILSVLLTAVACGTSGETSAETTPTDVTEEVETQKDLVYDDLEKQKFNRTFAILTREPMLHQYKAESLGGGLLNDTVYERNSTLSEDFGIEFALYHVAEGETDTSLKLQATGGLDEYDMYCGNKDDFKSCAISGYCYDLALIESLSLESEWWDQQCYENLTVEDRTYVMTGDIDPESMLISSCMVFNKKMMNELQRDVDNLFALARNGAWTLDVMYEYGQDVTFDLNGDGVMSHKDDRYNLACWAADAPFDLFWGAGGRFVSIVDGVPELTYTPEKVSNIYDKMYDIFVEEGAYFDSSDYWSSYNLFCQGRAMFLNINLSKLDDHGVTDMEDPYGILPIPKYDTNQKEYMSFVNGYTPLVMVAKTEKDSEFVGTIMEAMARYNYDNLTPNMFEIATKLQNAQDPDSAEMVDFVVRNRVFDLSYYCSWDISKIVPQHLAEGKDSIAAALKTQGTRTQRALTTLLNEYAKHD